jgi:16S rRNA (uracil1498-N3)-methyltransferase
MPTQSHPKSIHKTHRFMHPDFAHLKTGSSVVLPVEVSQHLRALRLKIGAHLSLLDGEGGIAEVCLEQASSKHNTVHVLEVQRTEKPQYRDVLVQALSGMDKMDWIIEKATELGIAEIYPVMTARSQIKLDLNVDPQRVLKKQQHWQSVARSACEQSGNLWLPSIAPVQTLTAALQTLQTSAANITQFIFDTQAHPSFISSDADLQREKEGMLKKAHSVHLAVGPEGGFNTEEIAQFTALGWQKRSLGTLILRTETAPIVALSQLALWRLLKNKI